jgi:hypothetical protein
VREPDWEEHRLLTGADRSVHLHVFSLGAIEPRRHLLFRAWLRANGDDRDRYAATKTELATRGFSNGMDYNNHKAALVYDIYERAFAADPRTTTTPSRGQDRNGDPREARPSARPEALKHVHKRRAWVLVVGTAFASSSSGTGSPAPRRPCR